MLWGIKVLRTYSRETSAAALAMFAVAFSPAVIAADLPLPRNGLVVRLDAMDSSSMTLDDAGHVTEWCSQVGSVKFVQESGQDATNLPYYKSSLNVPSGIGVPGVVFGLEPGYEYSGTTSDQAHNIMSYLKSDTSIDSREVFLVMVSMAQYSGVYNKDTVQGAKCYSNTGHIFGSGDADDSIQVAGNFWSTSMVYGDRQYFGECGMAWVNGEKRFDNGRTLHHRRSFVRRRTGHGAQGG